VRRFPALLACALAAACAADPAKEVPVPAAEERAAAPAPTAPAREEARAPAPVDAGSPPAARVPILFVHGIKGSASEYAVMLDRLVADGWPREHLAAKTFVDPEWGCNGTNANSIAAWVDELRAKTGAATIDLVAHSMGTLSSRHFLKALGGTDRVRRYVTLGGMHHGLSSPCLSPLDVCVWKELCATGPFVGALNEAPATPGPTRWWSIYSDADGTVPTTSSELAGATNVMIPGVKHAGAGGLLEAASVYAALKDALLAPANP
jgi:triacylglycerol lipase